MSGDTDEPVDELLAAAYAVDGPEENRALYARWAETYESQFIVDSKYIYHDRVAELFADTAAGHLAAGDVIVDIGCGTGLGGVSLRRRLTVDVDGLDISPEMLERAAAKAVGGRAVYRQLIEADLTRPLAIATDAYAGAVSAGTFTHGHVGPDALDEVVRIVRPGGIATIGINAAHFAAADFGPALERLADGGRIDGLRLVDIPIYADGDMDDPDNIGRVAVFIVT